MKDIYIEVLKIINDNDGIATNEETAHQIADFVRKEVSDEFMVLLNDFRQKCGGNNGI